MISLAQTTTLRFADTHPVDNPDSLEIWLKTYKKAPINERLKNLIALERTYGWVNKNKIGTNFTELAQLVVASKLPIAQAAYAFLKAGQRLQQDNTEGLVQQANHALRLFESLNDNSGIIHAHALLVATRARAFGTAPDTFLFAKEHLQTAEALLNKGDVHDTIMCSYWKVRVLYKAGQSPAEVDNLTTQLINGVLQRSDCRYALYAYKKYLSAYCDVKGQFERSYAINAGLLGELTDNQPVERTSVLYGIALNCHNMRKEIQSLSYFKKCLATAQRCSIINYTLVAGCYQTMREILIGKGAYRQASILADSAFHYQGLSFSMNVQIRAVELESQFELKRRQAENELLKQKQQVIKAENQLYNWGLILAISVIVLVTFLSLRLRRTYSRLSEALAEREQANLKLSQALTEVQELNKAREYFIGIIAHDMRRPLISYRGLGYLISELLKQGAFDKLQSVSIGIDKLGMDLEIMLDNLLKWALKQQQPLPYHPQRLVLCLLIDRVLVVFKQLVEYDGVEVVVDCPDDFQVWADEQGLELILRNLFENALRYTSSGGQIRLCVRAVDTNRVEVQIRDDGLGIEPEKLAYIQGVLSGLVRGEPGQRGLGLGLILVRDFVKQNLGQVQMNSILGQGTRCTVLLPAMP